MINKATLGTDVLASASEVESGLGFMLFIDNGLISTLEVFCHGKEGLPESLTNVSFEHLA